MESKITFGRWEAVTLLINCMCARIFLNLPRPMIESAGTAAWIQAVYISILVFLLFFVIEKLYSRFEGKDLLDIGEYVGGSFGRIIVGLMIFGILLYICPVILREYGENMKIISYFDSPISFIMLFFIAGMVFGAYLGLESLVRFHALIVPVIAAAYMVIIIALAPEYNTGNIYPILGNGLEEIFAGGIFKISIFAPLLYLFLLPPFIKTHRIFKSSGYIGIGISAFLIIISTITYLAAFSYPSSLESFLPTYQMARLVSYGRFFQRVESLFLLMWAASAFMYLSILLYFTTYIFRKTFRLKYHRPLIVPFAVVIFTLSLLPPNLMTAINLETKYYTYPALIVTFLMTILLLLIARIVKKRTVKGGSSL